jgi:hypothetical protein
MYRFEQNLRASSTVALLSNKYIEAEIYIIYIYIMYRFEQNLRASSTVALLSNKYVLKPNCWEFSEWLHNRQLLRKGSAP